MTDKELRQIVRDWRKWLDDSGGKASLERLLKKLEKVDEYMRMPLETQPLGFRKELADLRAAIFTATKARMMTAEEIETQLEEFRKWFDENRQSATAGKLARVLAETNVLKKHAAFHGGAVRRDVAILRSSLFYALQAEQSRDIKKRLDEFRKGKVRGASA